MKALSGCLIGLVFVVSASAEPLLEGRVRLESGQPVADAQVRIFDLSDLRQGAIARALTDGTGYFALPLAALGGRALPERFALGPNYPNPFNPSTIIPYRLAASAEVRLEVFNLLGQHIATLVEGERPAGFHTATWHATDGAGRAVGAGVYIYRMTVDVERQTGRMVLLDGQAGVSAGGAASVMPGASGLGGSDGEGAQVYGLIVSGSGLVPYVDSSFRVEAGMAPVELVVSSGQYSAGKATDDDCTFCDLFGTFNDQQEEEEDETPEEEEEEDETTEEEEEETDSTSNEGGPDLIVQAPSVSAVMLTPGQEFTLNATVHNQGDEQAAATMLHYYRSNNATITSSDTEVGTDEIGVLDASATSASSIALTAPTGVSAEVGIYYGACVASVRGESDTDNNCSSAVRITVSGQESPEDGEDEIPEEEETDSTSSEGGPDLIVQSPSVSAVMLTPGQAFTLNVTVYNQGDGQAAATMLHYYRSNNATITSSGTEVGTDAVGALDASATSAESIILTAPSDVGTYYYGACLERKSGESAGNNCSTGVRVTVDASSPKKVVRVLYVAPEDRPFQPGYSEGISKAIVDVQSWYHDQLGGPTFQLYSTTPEWCQMSGDSDYYSRGNAWEKVMEGVQHCAPVAWKSDFVWVLYVDVDEACDEPHELGAGWAGIAMVPRWDLEGLLSQGEEEYYYCDAGPYRDPLGRWFGGLAHELAHALFVPHPPGCDAGLPTCDSPALMSLGYPDYPDTYLRFDEKEILIRAPFITGEATPTDGSDATEGSLGVHGVVLDPSGMPVEGIRLSLVADPFWNWGETGQDGTFQIGLPDEASGPVVVSVHGGKAASCHWLGYHGPGGLTSLREDATQVAVGEADAAGIEVKLPFAPDVLCGRDRTISGTVLGPDGQPVAEVWVEIFEKSWFTEQNGTFEFIVPMGWQENDDVYIQNVDGCGLGAYGPNGLINWGEEVSLFEFGQVDLTGIEIRLPVSPDELCRQQRRN